MDIVNMDGKNPGKDTAGNGDGTPTTTPTTPTTPANFTMTRSDSSDSTTSVQLPPPPPPPKDEKDLFTLQNLNAKRGKLKGHRRSHSTSSAVSTTQLARIHGSNAQQQQQLLQPESPSVLSPRRAMSPLALNAFSAASISSSDRNAPSYSSSTSSSSSVSSTATSSSSSSSSSSSIPSALAEQQRLAQKFRPRSPSLLNRFNDANTSYVSSSTSSASSSPASSPVSKSQPTSPALLTSPFNPSHPSNPPASPHRHHVRRPSSPASFISRKFLNIASSPASTSPSSGASTPSSSPMSSSQSSPVRGVASTTTTTPSKTLTVTPQHTKSKSLPQTILNSFESLTSSSSLASAAAAAAKKAKGKGKRKETTSPTPPPIDTSSSTSSTPPKPPKKDLILSPRSPVNIDSLRQLTTSPLAKRFIVRLLNAAFMPVSWAVLYIDEMVVRFGKLSPGMNGSGMTESDILEWESSESKSPSSPQSSPSHPYETECFVQDVVIIDYGNIRIPVLGGSAQTPSIPPDGIFSLHLVSSDTILLCSAMSEKRKREIVNFLRVAVGWRRNLELVSGANTKSGDVNTASRESLGMEKENIGTSRDSMNSKLRTVENNNARLSHHLGRDKRQMSLVEASEIGNVGSKSRKGRLDKLRRTAASGGGGITGADGEKFEVVASVLEGVDLEAFADECSALIQQYQEQNQQTKQSLSIMTADSISYYMSQFAELQSMNTSLMETMSVIAKTNESLLERLNSLSTDHEKQKAQLQSLAKMVDQEEKGLVWTDILLADWERRVIEISQRPKISMNMFFLYSFLVLIYVLLIIQVGYEWYFGESIWEAGLWNYEHKLNYNWSWDALLHWKWEYEWDKLMFWKRFNISESISTSRGNEIVEWGVKVLNEAWDGVRRLANDLKLT